MLQDTEISLRTTFLVLLKPTLLFSWFQQTKVVLKPPSRKETTRREKSKVKPASTHDCSIFWVSSKSLLVSTKWTPQSQSHTVKTDSRKLTRKSRRCLPRLVSKPRRSHSSQCPDSKEITSLKNHKTWTGTKDSKSSQRRKKLKEKLFSIVMHHKTVDKAGPGDNVGVNVKGLPKENMPKVGDVMSVEGADGDDDPPKAAETFRAAVFVQDHSGQLKSASADGKGGFTPSIHVRTAKAPCQLMKILWKRGKSASNVKVEEPKFIEAGDEAEVIF